MKILRKVSIGLILMLSVLLLTGCSVVDGIERIMISEDNTSILQTVEDTNNIMEALNEAKEAMKTSNTKVFGNKALTGLSYKDVIETKDLKTEAQTKRYKDVIYHAYWDTERQQIFWSSDGTDDLMNADGNFYIVHEHSERIVNTMRVEDMLN